MKPVRPASPAFFAVAWLLPVGVGAAAWWSPWAAWAFMFGVQAALALLERVPALQRSPAPAVAAAPGFRAVPRVHVLLQAALLALGVAIAVDPAHSAWAVVALGIGIGGVTGSQGITFAHELGHARSLEHLRAAPSGVRPWGGPAGSRLDRALGWLLMGSVLYAHFMVEHYRGHHVRAATPDDPASARRGESLWRFLPRTLAGSLASAWRLEAAQLARRGRGWRASPLLWATLAQLAALAALTAAFGPRALLFALVQAGYAVFLLEAINYIEHYGLTRGSKRGRAEPFGLQHAWNADHAPTNALIVNLQRHSDHHMHAWKPYETLAPLPGPQLPTGYAGCLFLASVPALWFRLMEPRLVRLEAAARGAA